jgi:hypothetical protein
MQSLGRRVPILLWGKGVQVGRGWSSRGTVTPFHGDWLFSAADVGDWGSRYEVSPKSSWSIPANPVAGLEQFSAF